MRHWAAGVAAAVAIGVLGRGPARGLELTAGGRPLDLTGWLELRGIVRTDSSSPNELVLEQLWTRARYSVLDNLAIEAAINTQHGGPATEQTKGGIYSYRGVFQSVSPSVQFEDAFVDFTAGALDLRLGMQKFAWGKLDRFQPTDVLNVERYSDPFLLDEEERKIAVPAIQASYSLPRRDWIPEESRVALIWIPQYFPYRFPLLGERWFPPAAVPPESITVPVLGPIPISFRLNNTAPPSFRMENAGYAARVSGFSHGVDYAFCYYHGFDRAPAFMFTAEASGEPAPTMPPFFVDNVTAASQLAPVFRSIDLVGGDAAYAWGDFTVRFEAAFINGRPFARSIRDLLAPDQLTRLAGIVIPPIAAGNSPVPVPLPQSFAVRDAVEWGLGVDYTWQGYLLLVQVNQTDVLHNDVELLIKDVDTVLVGNLRKDFWHDDVTAQVVAIQGLESGYTLLMPRITYRFWERFEARAGYLFISGRENSVIGQYKNNDEAFFWLRYLI